MDLIKSSKHKYRKILRHPRGHTHTHPLLVNPTVSENKMLQLFVTSLVMMGTVLGEVRTPPPWSKTYTLQGEDHVYGSSPILCKVKFKSMVQVLYSAR